MPRSRYLLGLSSVLMWLCLFTGLVVAQANPRAQLVVYYSPKCSHCGVFDEQLLPPLAQAYQDRMDVVMVDVTTLEGMQRLEAEEQRLKSPPNPSLPVVQLGDTFLSYDDPFKLEANLKLLLRATLGAPTVQAASPTAEPTPSSRAVSETVVAPAIHLAYVEKDGCEKCARASVVLEGIVKAHPNVVIHTFNDVRDAALVEEMGEYLGLPQMKRLVTPAVYVGRDALVDTEISAASLEQLLARYAQSGAPPFWEGLSREAGVQRIVSRFQSMGPWAVVLAAAVDGINPCAFATILFFVSYLAISRRPRRELLLVGLAFTLGVFATYLAVGMGAMSLLRLASGIRIVATVIYGAMGAACVVLAVMSARDYVLARQGRLHEMSLNLPDGLRERIKGRLRAASGAYAGAALVSGLIVSLLELACTGQVYLPTISFVVGMPQLRAYGVAYLALYNVIFVAPLLIILFLAVYGVSASRFQDWFVKNVAATKIVLAVVFLVLGGLLLAQAVGV